MTLFPECSAARLVSNQICKGEVAEEEVHGVWRQGSQQMTTVIPPSPPKVMRWMDRNTRKRGTWRSGSSVNPKRMDSVAPVLFSIEAFFNSA